MVAKLPMQATMNADGSGLTNLTNNPAEHDAPVWSPDGSQIAFTFSREGGLEEVYAVNADGAGPARVTTGGGQAAHWGRAGRAAR